jgi:hypothetical protein
VVAVFLMELPVVLARDEFEHSSAADPRLPQCAA